MSTRTIVTSQPDVACDVCERRLLRGEQPDAFIAAGRRLLVCELCAPRAAHEGWMRETDGHQVELPPMRPRRGRSLLERLPVPVWARQAPRASGSGRASSDGRPFDFLDDGAAPREEGAQSAGAEALPHPESVAELSYLERALQTFNASEFPRRVAGVARSLGAPEVSVRSAEHLESVVVIVVAWELCWYRYEVDLSEGIEEVRVLGQGTELGELPHDDRLANALASDTGALAFGAAAR